MEIELYTHAGGVAGRSARMRVNIPRRRPRPSARCLRSEIDRLFITINQEVIRFEGARARSPTPTVGGVTFAPFSLENNVRR
ncbi:hypothetical protein EVAR_45832_1 [Eumeta japonica]|uniref:Uncharacterized protein n=1 Tax=Eumeta variegata TaxID=151549 RepID=A0A4C1WLU4_EUMVA|nr:hypothetical protein EVAR_45832_1 [Eumeta japonica]